MKAKIQKLFGKHDVFVINKTSDIIKTAKLLAENRPFSFVWQYNHRTGLFHILFYQGTEDIKNATIHLKYLEGVKSYRLRKSICLVQLTPEAMSSLGLD